MNQVLQLIDLIDLGGSVFPWYLASCKLRVSTTAHGSGTLDLQITCSNNWDTGPMPILQLSYVFISEVLLGIPTA